METTHAVNNSTGVDMKSIEELSGYKFYIPNYQRGYKWSDQQVTDLLEDIKEFYSSPQNDERIYCIQPLVVISKSDGADDKDTVWEVIDGQQRLTTISIIYQALTESAPYTIKYAVLPNSEKINHLAEDGITQEDADKNSNLYYMKRAREVASEWIKNELSEGTDTFLNVLSNRVKFIWYLPEDKDPISVFTRLNVGRISLTSSELIKALFLNRGNFPAGSKVSNTGIYVESEQLRIAMEWDKIETTLHDSAFWYYLRNLEKGKDFWALPTRIDFLLEFVQKKFREEFSTDSKIIGSDKYRLFRSYYYAYKQCEKKADFLAYWRNKIMSVFDVFYEWYTDPKWYHYVGYLITQGYELSKLYDWWIQNDRAGFEDKLKDAIAKKIGSCKDLEHEYETNSGGSKRNLIPLLLLHNIDFVLQQNSTLENNDSYNQGVFYKFPFHLYKLESWDVEHVDSDTTNNLGSDDDRQDWLLSVYGCLPKTEQDVVHDDLKNYFCKVEEKKALDSEEADKFTAEIDSDWSKLVTDMTKAMKNVFGKDAFDETEHEDWKNKAQNFVLLDSSTNRSYQNAIFPAKRNHIVGKERGILTKATWNTKEKRIEIKTEPAKSAFVPEVTKNVFQKMYSVNQTNPTRWSEADSNAYKEELEKVIEKYTGDK